MPRSSARFALLVVCLLSATDAPRAGDAGNRALVVTAARIYTAPDAKPIEDGVVVIKDGRIAAVGVRGAVKAPAESDSIGSANVIVTAGFQNSHVHFIESKWAIRGGKVIFASESDAQ